VAIVIVNDVGELCVVVDAGDAALVDVGAVALINMAALALVNVGNMAGVVVHRRGWCGPRRQVAMDVVVVVVGDVAQRRQ
jgi:hypothetical protein